MNFSQDTWNDIALIAVGAALNTLLVSIGNRQNPIPIAGLMLMLVAIVGGISFALAWPVRTIPLAIFGCIATTELGFLLYFVCRVAFAERLHPHICEELYLFPQVFAVSTAPTILFSSIGFARMANRIYQKGDAGEHVEDHSTFPG